MTLYIEGDKPPTLQAVAKILLLMTWNDLETFALTIESLRSGGKGRKPCKNYWVNFAGDIK